jgi:hypothetical protein
MNISKTMPLVITLIGVLGLFGLVRTVQAIPAPNPVVVKAKPSQVTAIPATEKNEGPNDRDSKHEDADKEANDTHAISKPVTRANSPSRAASNPKNQAEEAHDTPHDADSKHEDAH